MSQQYDKPRLTNTVGYELDMSSNHATTRVYADQRKLQHNIFSQYDPDEEREMEKQKQLKHAQLVEKQRQEQEQEDKRKQQHQSQVNAMNANNTNPHNGGTDGKPSIKLTHPPGGHSNFSLFDQ